MTEALQRWATDRLPASEFLVQHLGAATRVTTIRPAEERTGPGGVVALVDTVTSLSGAPWVGVTLLDEDEDLDAAAAALADGLVEDVRAHGRLELLGPGAGARAVASALADAVGGRTSQVMAQRLMAAVTVTAPCDVPGGARLLQAHDHAVVARWLDAFSEEALGLEPRGETAWSVELRTATGMRVWADRGELVAVAMGRWTTPVSARIGPVYTPPQHRRRGYAAALTAALARELLDDGAERVVLLTDVGNPTSNRLYPRIGFEDLVGHENWLVEAPG